MAGRSKLWLLAAALIGAGAVLEAVALTLYWRPCAGAVLNGSILQGYAYNTHFSDACLVAMDRAPLFQLPQPGEGLTLIGSLGSGAAILLAVAWLVLLPALRVSKLVGLVAALPGILALALVADSVAMSLVPPLTEDGLGRGLSVLSELSVGLAVIALGAAGVRGLVLARAAIVALAATSAGLFHQIADYIASIALSDANWDVPPGGGSVIVGLCLVTAIATIAGWSHDRGNRAPSVPAAVAVTAPV
jgi:hypothetical protein